MQERIVKKDKAVISVEVSIFDAVLRMVVTMKEDCIHKNAIIIWERMDTLQGLHHMYHGNEMKAWLHGHKEDE